MEIFSRLSVLVIHISFKEPLNTHFDMELNTSALCKNKKQRNNENGLAKIEYSFCFCWILLRDCFYKIYILSFLSNIHAIWQGKNVQKNWFGVNIVFEKPSMIGAMHGNYSIFNPWMMQIISERQRQIVLRVIVIQWLT